MGEEEEEGAKEEDVGGEEGESGRRLEDWEAGGGESSSRASRIEERGMRRENFVSYRDWWRVQHDNSEGKGRRRIAHHVTPRVHQRTALQDEPPFPPSPPLTLLHQIPREDDLVRISRGETLPLLLYRLLLLLVLLLLLLLCKALHHHLLLLLFVLTLHRSVLPLPLLLLLLLIRLKPILILTTTRQPRTRQRHTKRAPVYAPGRDRQRIRDAREGTLRHRRPRRRPRRRTGARARLGEGEGGETAVEGGGGGGVGGGVVRGGGGGEV